MKAIRLLRGLTGGDSLPRFILFILVFAAAPLAEVFTFLWLGNIMGNYLVLVLAAVAGIPGALIGLDQLRRALARSRERVQKGLYPGRELVALAGLAAAGLLLVTPGFITDVAGYLLLIPRLRAAVGKRILETLRKSSPELHAFLRAGEL
jgi:UPF0716 protein FxsA